jgi:beta-lactamase regulating signal transducer with metallopeptidase domain
MTFAQTWVIGWIECAAAATILLFVTQVIASRLRQPVDRINLIAMSLVASAFVPWILLLGSFPSFHLGLLTSAGNNRAAVSTASKTAGPSQFELPVESDKAAPSTDRMIASVISAPTSASSETKSDVTSVNSIALESSSGLTSPAVSSPASRVRFWSIAAGIVLVGHGLAIAFFFAEWTIGTIRLRNICRQTWSPEKDVIDLWKRISGGRGSVRLLVTAEISTPLVYGLWRPVVLIPEAIATGDHAALRFCLSHEWSHICQGDLFTRQLTNLCQLLLWYQPLFWLLRRELRICQDLVADDRAAGATGDHLDRVKYSELLISIAKQTMRPRMPEISGAIALLDRSSQLSRRIRVLLASEHSLRRRSRRSFLVISALLSLTALSLVGSVRLQAARADEPLPNKALAPPKLGERQKSGREDVTVTDENLKRVRGRVVDEAGKPVAGAKLWLPLQYQPRRTVEATADVEGKFELKFPFDWISPRVSGSSWTVWAYAPGYSIQSQSVYEVLRKGSNEEYTIQLPPEAKVRFKVLSTDGKPLAGVLVQPKNYRTTVGFDLVPEEMLATVSARTNDDGLVTLAAIQPGPLYLLQMTSDVFGRQSIRVDANPDAPDREIRFQPTSSIKGKLVAENPEWVRGVRIVFETANRTEGQDAQGTAEVVTDGDGHFEAPLIASGGPLLTYVFLDAKLPVRPRLSEEVYVRPGETLDLEIPLVAAPLVQGKVVHKSTGKPVPNAEISLGYGSYRQSEQVITDENGQYAGRVVPGPIGVHIIVLPDNLVQLESSWEKTIRVPSGVKEFDLPAIEVVGTYELKGKLVNAKDQSMANERLSAGHENRSYGSSSTDAEGRFSMRVPDGVETQIRIYVEDRGYEPVTVVQQEPLVVRYVEDDYEMKIEAEWALRHDVVLIGSVLSDGKPVGALPVVLNRGVRVFQQGSGGEPARETGTRYGKVSETKTDANGVYRLIGLKAGDRYQIEFKPSSPAADPNWHHQSPYVQDLAKDAKSEIVLPEVNLLKLNQSIAGVVVAPDGKPVEGATVSVQLRSGQHLPRMTDSGPPPWTKSDDQGRFQLRELPDAPLSIMAYFANPKGGPIRFLTKLDVERDQQDIRIVLDPSRRAEAERE